MAIAGESTGTLWRGPRGGNIPRRHTPRQRRDGRYGAAVVPHGCGRRERDARDASRVRERATAGSPTRPGRRGLERGALGGRPPAGRGRNGWYGAAVGV